MPAAVPGLRHWWRGQAVAHGGYRYDAHVPGVRGAAGEMPGTWGAGGARAMGPTRCEMHVSVGGHVRVVGEEHGADRGDGFSAIVLADRRVDRRPGRPGPDR